MKKIVSSALVASMLLSFAACSGGGSSSTPSATALSAIASSGVAVDGYIIGGKACLDLNLNSACDAASEPTDTTDNNGKFSLDVTPVHQQHDNYAKAPVIVVGGKDLDTGKTFIGLMKAPFDGNATDIVVSPLTTMVKAIMDSGSKTKEEATEAVAGALGLDKDDVLKDPVDLFNTKPKVAKAALTIQKSVELLALANITASVSDTQTEAFNTIYKQLSDATIIVSQNTTMDRLFATIVTEANLTDGALQVVSAIQVMEDRIGAISDEFSLGDVARLTDKEVVLVKVLVKDTVLAGTTPLTQSDVNSTATSAETNIRVLLVEKILREIDAVDSQILTVLDLNDIQDLTNTDNNTTITNDLVKTAIVDANNTDIIQLAVKLGYELPDTSTPETPTQTPTECQNVNPINGQCEDEVIPTECQNVNPINGQCEDANTPTPAPTPTECQNVNPITGACEDTTTPTETPTECQNVNPITGTCEDTTTPTETPAETPTECQNVNPITGQCED